MVAHHEGRPGDILTYGNFTGLMFLVGREGG